MENLEETRVDDIGIGLLRLLSFEVYTAFDTIDQGILLRWLSTSLVFLVTLLNGSVPYSMAVASLWFVIIPWVAIPFDLPHVSVLALFYLLFVLDVSRANLMRINGRRVCIVRRQRLPRSGLSPPKRA